MALGRKGNLRNLADEELMPLVAGRDLAAFEILYDRHAGPAYSLAHRIVGDSGTAEDVIQEAFLSIWRSEAGYDPARGSFRTWALGIVRNRAIDVLRRATAKRVPPRDFRGEDALADRPAAERTEDEALRRETTRELRGAIALLPPEQSRPLELAYFGGFSHSEVAEMLGVPIGTVKSRIRLGLEKIRAALAEGTLSA